MFEKTVFAIECLGTVAFAVSGALVAIEKKMDILGVTILGTITAVGGGFIRDLALNLVPPMVFVKPRYAIMAIASSIAIFFPAARKRIKKRRKIWTRFLLIADSIGLGIFTVVGIRMAKGAIPDCSLSLLLFVGVISGVGGGMLRDILAGNMPFIFVKDFYASASIIGAIFCAVLWERSESLAFCGGAALIVILRFLAVTFHWSLPKAR